MASIEEVSQGITKQFQDSFTTIRETHYNPNTKGYSYEKILKDFLEKYLGGILDFYVRSAILDSELKCFDIFGTRENEFDVIAMYKNASPKIVMEIQDTHFLSYDGVAFIVEVKQTLTKPSLEKDLKKLSKLSKLSLNHKRFKPSYYHTPLQELRPLHVLFYYETQADVEEISKLIEKYVVGILFFFSKVTRSW